MANYFIGRKHESIYQPIKIESIDTSIINVVNFTSTFIDEMDFKEYLLRNGLIEYYDEELFYLKEEGTKDNRKYRPINLGSNIAYGAEKRYFDVDNLYNYLIAHKYDTKFIDSLTYHYIEKYDVTSLIKDRIKTLFSKRALLEDFLNKLVIISSNYSDIRTKILGLYDKNDLFGAKKELEYLSETVVAGCSTVVPLYHYFKNKLDIPYGIILNYLSQLYVLASKAIEKGIEIVEKNEAERNAINKTIEYLLTSIVYKYDPITKKYKKENNEYILYERNLADLGLYIMVYERKIQDSLHKEEYFYEEDQEEYLEEEDFKRMHTTSEREGIKLVYKDNQKNS